MTGHQSLGATPPPETAAVETWITGRVQGVGFRYFAFEAARRLGVVGYVRNTRDGGVRAYAEGPREKLEQFVRILEQGPQGSRVREMRVTWGSGSGSYSTFHIETTL
jgi:acylphosphatase